ncbi:MAG: hypothetical protein RSD41_00755 [Kiritimatiellia bacterium]
MQELIKRIGYGFLIVVALVSATTAIAYLVPQWRTWSVNCVQRELLQTEVDNIQQNIASVKRNIVRFNGSPYFVEQLARSNHRVNDKEIVFIFE